MELSIQERLKDLRVERGLTLEQLEEQVNLSKSALGSYEAKDFKDISHYAIIKLAKFYGVTADYLLGLSQMKKNVPWHILAPRRGCFGNHLPLRRVRILAECFCMIGRNFLSYKKSPKRRSCRPAFE